MQKHLAGLDAPVGEVTCPPDSHLETRDKAAVEAAVKHSTTHILTRLESRQFFSIAELNAAICPLLDQLNRTPF